MPCKGGYRERIEAGKRRREAEKQYERSAERQYWLDLSSRAYVAPEGPDLLAPNERIYFALGCLIGEVHNGGLEQFFFNSSGSMYGAALEGLFEVKAHKTANLLVSAKELLFGSAPVPADTAERRKLLQTRGTPPEIEALDKAFWRNEEKLNERCKTYAANHQLYRDA